MSRILSNKKVIQSQKNKTGKFEPSHNDINDIFYILTTTISIIDKFFTILYSAVSFILQILFSKKNFISSKMCFYSFFVIFLFSLSQGQNISMDLIMKAYFNKSNVVHISYDNIKLTEKNFEKEFKKNRAYKKDANYHERYQNDGENNDYFHCIDINDIYKIENENDNLDNELYLFNLIPIKTIFITFFAFFLLYIVIKTTYYSKITNSIIINLIGLYITFKIMSYFYSSKYYLASGFIFILFFYFYKCALDSFYIYLKFNENDFEIFSNQLCANNGRQFWLKFNMLFSGTIISGFLSIYYFNLYFNYIAFYMCLFTLIIFLCNCLEKNYLFEYKYCKNIFIFVFGNINFAINKFLSYKYYYNNCFFSNSRNNKNKNKNLSNINSFYLISDIFSLLCFDYIDNYIEFKYQYYLGKRKKFKKIFSFHDIMFICLFFVVIIISIHGVIYKEYTSYYLALSISKKFNSYFPIIFNYNIGRIFNHIMIIAFIFTQYEISTSGDEYMINIISKIKLGKNIISIILKILSLCTFLLNLIYSNYLYYYSDDCHQNLYHYSKSFVKFNDINEILKQEYENDNDDEINSDDDEIIDLNINNLNDKYNKKYKIKIISNNICNNKTKDNLFMIDFSLCYIDLILTIIFAVYYEYSFIIKAVYIIVISFLLTRKFYLLNEIKGKVLYFIYYVISFIFSSRLIFFTCIDSYYLAYIMEINMFALLNYYCFNNRRNLFVTFMTLIHLIVAYYKKNFIFFIFDFVFVILILIFRNFNNKQTFKMEKYDEQNNHLSLIFLVTLVTFFLIQLYGINKLLGLVQGLYNSIMDYLNKINLMLSSKNNNDIRLIEYYIITDIIDWIDPKLQ